MLTSQICPATHEVKTRGDLDLAKFLEQLAEYRLRSILRTRL
jgi:hypothetical protein